MGSIAVTVFGWLTAVVAVVALVAGPSSAANIAGNALRTVGITAGALVGGVDNLVTGFRNASGGSNEGSLFNERPRDRDRGNGGRGNGVRGAGAGR